MNLIRGMVVETGGKMIFTSGNFQLEIPTTNLGSRKEILLGIRPEVFSVGKLGGSLSEVNGILTLTERLGSASNYYMESALSLDSRLTASTQGAIGSEGFEIGKEIVFSILRADVHLFDPKTGLRIE